MHEPHLKQKFFGWNALVAVLTFIAIAVFFLPATAYAEGRLLIWTAIPIGWLLNPWNKRFMEYRLSRREEED